MPKTVFHDPPQIVIPRRGSLDVPNTPEARAHAEDAQKIAAELEEFGIVPERVAPTRDCKGHVRLNFEQVRQLLGI